MQQYSNELYHHGVKGMKWGVRRKRAESKYAKAGRAKGQADYERSKGAELFKKHESAANTLERASKAQTKKGYGITAVATQRSAEALRQRGARLKAEQDREAARLEKYSIRMTAKADAYATKKRVNLGKERIDAIMKKSRKEGFENAKWFDEQQKRRSIEERYGDNAVDAYDKLRGVN